MISDNELSVNMKHFILSFTACVVAVMSTSCSKESIEQQGKTFDVSITAELGEFDPLTKSTAESCVRLRWDGGETVYAYSELSDGTISAAATLTVSIPDSRNPYVAELKGTITAPADANKTLYLVHSSSGTPEIANRVVTVAMNGVQASGKVPVVAYAKLTGVTQTDYQTSGLKTKFSFASSVINVNITGLGPGMALSSATVTGIAPNCTITLNSDSDIAAGKSGSATTYTKALAGTVTTSGKAQFFLAVPTMEASSERVITVTDGTKKYREVGFVSKAHSANSYINTICCVSQVVLLPGEFSVSATKKVRFTTGNLYYSTTDNAYHIEDAQNVTYVTLGQTTYDASHVCHFFWSNSEDWQTSGREPWASSYSYGDQSTYDEFFCGIDNPMTVDGQSGLYALTGGSDGEWCHLINSRTNASSLHKYGVSVTTSIGNVANCLVIAPDNWDYTTYPLQTEYSDFSSPLTWTAAESAGLVCLPTAGIRNSSNNLVYGGSDGSYWSATPTSDLSLVHYAHNLLFNGTTGSPDFYGMRSNGYSVRLVSTVTD